MLCYVIQCCLCCSQPLLITTFILNCEANNRLKLSGCYRKIAQLLDSNVPNELWADGITYCMSTHVPVKLFTEEYQKNFGYKGLLKLVIWYLLLQSLHKKGTNKKTCGIIIVNVSVSPKYILKILKNSKNMKQKMFEQ